MKKTYDDAANASYYILNETVNRTVAKTVQVSPICNVDIDVEGYPLGIEILQAERQKREEGVGAVRAKTLLDAVEILHKHAMKTKDIKALDLIEEMQRELLQSLTPLTNDKAE